MVLDGGGGSSDTFYLDGSWPGLEATKDVDIDKDEVERILKELRADYEGFSNGSGTVNDLQSKGNINTAHLGNYPAAQSLQASTQATYNQFTAQYNSFLNSYEAIITALENAVKGYKDMETNNTASANGVTSGGGGGSKPTTGNTQSYA
ncbi:hypothetical protein ACGFNU_46310 [Spirillospora sp. NPDC048911]|uniref:hypothetical protein n=1 Tax=Spirillospora sp. NPDC048911 TaxID=3364527 RepID=UPI003718E54E